MEDIENDAKIAEVQRKPRDRGGAKNQRHEGENWDNPQYNGLRPKVRQGPGKRLDRLTTASVACNPQIEAVQGCPASDAAPGSGIGATKKRQASNASEGASAGEAPEIPTSEIKETKRRWGKPRVHTAGELAEDGIGVRRNAPPDCVPGYLRLPRFRGASGRIVVGRLQAHHVGSICSGRRSSRSKIGGGIRYT